MAKRSTIFRTAPSPSVVVQKQPGAGALVTLFFGTAFIFANMYTTQAILPVFSYDFHVSAPTAGFTVSVLVLAVAIGSLFYGPLSDRIGRKPVMVTTSVLLTIPTLLCGFAPTFAALIIFRALQGLLVPGLTSVAIAYVHETFAGKRQGLAMGIYVSGTVLGGLFARVGSGLLTGFYGWRPAMLAFALPTLIAALAMWHFLPQSSSKQHVEVRPHTSLSVGGSFLRQALSDMGEHLHNRRLVGAYVIGFTLFFGFIGAFTYLPYYLTGPQFKLSNEAVSLVYVLWLTGIFSPVAGSLAARLGPRRAIASSMALAALGLVITLVPILPAVIVGLGLLTLGMFATIPAVNLYVNEQATKAKGTAASMYLSLYYVGGSFGAIVPGFALLWIGWSGVVLLCLVMVALALSADAFLCC
jgi:MFS transporter, YNFM family, putative membrane transport protein